MYGPNKIWAQLSGLDSSHKLNQLLGFVWIESGTRVNSVNKPCYVIIRQNHLVLGLKYFISSEIPRHDMYKMLSRLYNNSTDFVKIYDSDSKSISKTLT